MSVEGVTSGERAVAQRVQQLQSMIQQIAAGGAIPASTQSSGSSTFASALQSATSATPVAYAASTGGTGSTQYDGLIAQAATRYGIDPAVLHGLIQQESGFNPSSRSSAGAVGLTQLMPGTASSLGVANPLDPAESIDGGARYLSQMMAKFGGNTSDALAAYNAGPGAVQRYGGVPPYAETQSYVSKVLAYAQAFRQSQPAAAATATATPTATATGSVA